MERMFAQPFICQLGSGHVDGVYQLAKDPSSLNLLASASGEGIVKVWDLESREQTWTASAHTNLVKGLAWTKDQKVLTCGTDKKIHLFDPTTSSNSAPVTTWTGANAFSSLSHHRSKNAFATSSGSKIQIYDLERFSAAPEEYSWPNATDSINAVRFNPVEQSVLASTASDRSIVIWDARLSTPVTKTVLTFASNGISWNPMEAVSFILYVLIEVWIMLMHHASSTSQWRTRITTATSSMCGSSTGRSTYSRDTFLVSWTLSSARRERSSPPQATIGVFAFLLETKDIREIW